MKVIRASGHQYFSGTVNEEHAHFTGAGGGEHGGAAGGASAKALTADDLKVPMLRNYLLSSLAGTTWYMQFFFYTMGETQMGRFGFASWTLHMASTRGLRIC